MDDPLDDLDQILDDADRSVSKSIKQGRRAKQEAANVPSGSTHTAHSSHTPDGMEKLDEPHGSDGPPKRAKRTGGWGEERKGGSIPELEDERLKMRSPSPGSDRSDTDIPVIPNLEENAEEDFNTMIAMAPNVAVNRVATYRELDNDLLQHAQFMHLDNEVDLKLLGKCLSNEVDIKEEDKPWDWDRLFTEVTSELLTEWAGDEKREEDLEPIGIST